MKKLSILVLIAIFITGSLTTATAQSPTAEKKVLRSGQILKVKNSVATPKTDKRSVMRAGATAASGPYWSVAQSYRDEYDQFAFDGLIETDYYTEVTINGDKATFSNIVDNSNFYGWTGCNPVTGVYDADAGTITVSTPSITEDRVRGDYTELGKMLYFGDSLYVVLVAGDFSTVPTDEGSYPLYMEEELVFDVSDDGTTLTPRTGFGAIGMFMDTEFAKSSVAGYMTFYKTATIMKMPDEPVLVASPETLDLTENTIFTNTQYTTQIKLKNMGLSDADYTVTTSTDEIKLQNLQTIQAGSIQTLGLLLTAKNEGPFTGTVTFTDQNGKQATLTVKADIQQAYDYSSVIKNGDIKISHYDQSTSAAEITSDITGFPVLVTTNTGNNTRCGFNVNFTVPEGQVATFAWKGYASGKYPNQASVMMQDGTIISEVWDINNALEDHDMADKIVLASGTYNMLFQYSTSQDWYSQGIRTEPLRAYFYDFDLQLYPESEANVAAYSDEVTFAKAYFDNLPKTDTVAVKLYNLGTQPLTVTGIESDGPFSAVIDEIGEIAPYETGYAKLTFTREGVGEYEGDVVLKTTGGNVTIHCNATTEEIIYDYSAIVSQGDFSFDTGMEYPWVVEGNKAYNSTAGMIAAETGYIPSWLEASFVVPEGQTGTLTWNGRISSTPLWEFMGELIFLDGVIIYIDGVEVVRFAGTQTAGSEQFEEPLTFSAGQHSVKFVYDKSSTEPEGEDRYQVYNLSLELAPASGINTIDVNGAKAVKSVEYYTVSGERITAPTKGVTIIKNVYEDGTISTSKVVMK